MSNDSSRSNNCHNVSNNKSCDCNCSCKPQKPINPLSHGTLCKLKLTKDIHCQLLNAGISSVVYFFGKYYIFLKSPISIVPVTERSIIACIYDYIFNIMYCPLIIDPNPDKAIVTGNCDRPIPKSHVICLNHDMTELFPVDFNMSLGKITCACEVKIDCVDYIMFGSCQGSLDDKLYLTDYDQKLYEIYVKDNGKIKPANHLETVVRGMIGSRYPEVTVSDINIEGIEIIGQHVYFSVSNPRINDHAELSGKHFLFRGTVAKTRTIKSGETKPHYLFVITIDEDYVSEIRPDLSMIEDKSIRLTGLRMKKKYALFNVFSHRHR